jgi:hypothetical protein
VYVPVHQSLLVQVGQGLAKLAEDAEHLVRRKFLLAIGLPTSNVVGSIRVKEEDTVVVDYLKVFGHAKEIGVLELSVVLSDVHGLLAFLLIQGGDIHTRNQLEVATLFGGQALDQDLAVALLRIEDIKVA